MKKVECNFHKTHIIHKFSCYKKLKDDTCKQPCLPFSWLWLVRIAALTSLAVLSRCDMSSRSPTGQLATSSKANSATVLSNSSKKFCCRKFHFRYKRSNIIVNRTVQLNREVTMKNQSTQCNWNCLCRTK